MKWFSDEEIDFYIKDMKLHWQEENQRLDKEKEEADRRFILQLSRLITEARFQGKEELAAKFEGLREEFRCLTEYIH